MNISASYLMSYVAHTDNVTQLISTGESVPAITRYRCGNNYHTVVYVVENFVGRVVIQATVTATPAEQDWVSVVDDEYLEPATLSQVANFIGNFALLRAQLIWTQGIVSKIQVNG